MCLLRWNHLKVVPFCHKPGTTPCGDHGRPQVWPCGPGLSPRRRSTVSSNPHGMPLDRSRELSRSSAVYVKWPNGFILQDTSKNLEISKYLEIYLDYRYEFNVLNDHSTFVGSFFGDDSLSYPKFRSRWDCYQLLQDRFIPELTTMRGTKLDDLKPGKSRWVLKKWTKPWPTSDR